MSLSAGSRTGVPGFNKDGAMHRRDLVRYLEQIQLGHIACVGDVTLTANSNTTTINDSRIGAGSFMFFMPTTQNAAQEIGNGNLYVTTGKQTCTVNHSNNAQTDRTFKFLVIG